MKMLSAIVFLVFLCLPLSGAAQSSNRDGSVQGTPASASDSTPPVSSPYPALKPVYKGKWQELPADQPSIQAEQVLTITTQDREGGEGTFTLKGTGSVPDCWNADKVHMLFMWISISKISVLTDPPRPGCQGRNMKYQYDDSSGRLSLITDRNGTSAWLSPEGSTPQAAYPKMARSYSGKWTVTRPEWGFRQFSDENSFIVTSQEGNTGSGTFTTRSRADGSRSCHDAVNIPMMFEWLSPTQLRMVSRDPRKECPVRDITLTLETSGRFSIQGNNMTAYFDPESAN